MLYSILSPPADLVHPFWVFDWSEVWAPQVAWCSIVLFLSGILCSAAGIGGGGVYVAVLMVVGTLSPHNAVPLSKAVVFFGAMSTLLLNCRRQRDPQVEKKQAVIDFHTVRTIVPGALLGTYLGVALNFHAEGTTIVVLLALLLSLMTYTVTRTAWLQYCEEEKALLVSSKVSGEGAAEGLVEGAHAHGNVESSEEAPLLPDGAAAQRKARGNSFSSLDLALTGSLLLTIIFTGVLKFHMRACQVAVETGTAGACEHPMLWIFGGGMKSWMANPALAWTLQYVLVGLAVAYGLFV